MAVDIFFSHLTSFFSCILTTLPSQCLTSSLSFIDIVTFLLQAFYELYICLLFYRDLDLKRPIYQEACVYGHFKPGFSWEVPKELAY